MHESKSDTENMYMSSLKLTFTFSIVLAKRRCFYKKQIKDMRIKMWDYYFG